jgi:hypothetical protein
VKKRIRERAVELGIGDVSFMQVQPLPLWAGEVEKRKVMDPDTADYWESRGLVSDCTSIMKNAKTVIAAFFIRPGKLQCALCGISTGKKSCHRAGEFAEG